MLRAAAATPDEAVIACELFLSPHAVRERLARLEAKLGVRTAADARRQGASRDRVDSGHGGARVLTLRWSDQEAELFAPPGPPLDEVGQRHRRRPAGAP